MGVLGQLSGRHRAIDVLLRITGKQPRPRHPWLRIHRVLCVMLQTRWSAEAWSVVRVEFRRALALRSEIRRARSFNQLFSLFLGVKTDRIAKKLHCSAETVGDLMATAEFQTLYAEYERQQKKAVDQWMPRLLLASIEPLAKMLKHTDWRALREGDNQERVAVLRAEA